MRNMSVSKTIAQCRAFEKTVTRRNGWWNLQAGEILQLVEKAQGLKLGEKVKHIHKIQVIEARVETLDTILTLPEYGRLEMIREGFPEMPAKEFVEMYCKMNKCGPRTMVNRISFRYYLDPANLDLALAVPAKIATCPHCEKNLTIHPDGYYLTHDGSMACDSFTTWCQSEPLSDNSDDWDLFDKSHQWENGNWEAISTKIENWLLDTFRFEIGGGE